MRVGFDARWHGDSGVGNYVSDLVRAMSSLDGNMEIILYEDPDNRMDHAEVGRISSIPIRSRKYSLWEQFELAHRCRVDRLDVFHSPFYVTPWLAPCPVVVTIHDLIPFLFKAYTLPKQHLIKFGYRLAVKKATRVIAASNNTRDDLMRILNIGTEKTTVVHLATSPDRFHPIAEPEERDYLLKRYGIRQPYVLVLSARNWQAKNLPVVLEALAVCQQQTGLAFQAVIAGPPEGYRKAFRGETPAAPANVVLTGFVSAEDLPKLYRNADVFLLGSKYEGFGLPLLEAMSCGCAVVCSNGGSLTEVAGQGAILVASNDPLQMARAVSQLLSNQGEREQLKARALKRARDFSWEKTARETVSVYAQAREEGLCASASAETNA
jgi:glycosyltransferase involved in cell wall biosynthesis